jgi:hypothetical protein
MIKTTQRDRFFIDAVQHSHLNSSPQKISLNPKRKDWLEKEQPNQDFGAPLIPKNGK